MTPYFAIVYVILALQVTLGVSMIATASVAANRRLNAPHRSVDVAFYVLGCVLRIGNLGAVDAGGHRILALTDTNRCVVCLCCFGAVLGAALGRRLVAGAVARSLIVAPPIEQHAKTNGEFHSCE